MIDLIKYDIDTVQYTGDKAVPTDFIDGLFFNAGTATAWVNNFPIAPNNTLPITGNIGEVMKKQINLKFTGAGTKNVYLMRRFYLL